MLASRTDIIAAHEAGHAVVSRALGSEVTRASAREGDSGVRTRTKFRRDSAADYAKALRNLILIDLSGPLAESHAAGAADDHACRADERNALSRALRLVLDRHGVRDDELDDRLRAEAKALVASLRPKAAALLEENWPAIERVAEARWAPAAS